MDLAVSAQELIQQHSPAMEVGSALDKTQISRVKEVVQN